ncbi:hypothetical protein PACTADRAFT_50410 [Pachysolen tannophilus NRRL Y-2460]|uniref:DNA repair and recombination protein RAD52 n=1 Tax=Pachysolen tannophilus NRRL Y-2460 TaxID=669874 RepID=A0A1E4TRZ1_PACTA|nr:hypothetical protein PACTADRAFT_50410 [Pachysolen tannophilus NRRL Y-2460]
MINNSGHTVDESRNSGGGFCQYTEEEKANLKYNLEKCLGPEYVSFRAAAGGSQVIYIEGWKALNLANQVFGFNGWNSEIRSSQVDYVDGSGGRWSLGLSVVVRVTIKDGTYHEDIGYGSIENCKSRSMAFDKAKKEAVTDAVKRALRQFGNVLGNCLYEKNYLQKVKQVKKITKDLSEDQLLRPMENVNPNFKNKMNRNGNNNNNNNIENSRGTGNITNNNINNNNLPVKSRHKQLQNDQGNNSSHNNDNNRKMTTTKSGRLIPEDAFIEDSFLFSDEVLESEDLMNGIDDYEMQLLLNKNISVGENENKSNSENAAIEINNNNNNNNNRLKETDAYRTPEAPRVHNQNQLPRNNGGNITGNSSTSESKEPASVAFVSTRLARNLIETAPSNTLIPVAQQIMYNPQVQTPTIGRSIDANKSVPILRTPGSATKVIYKSSRKPLNEYTEDLNSKDENSLVDSQPQTDFTESSLRTSTSTTTVAPALTDKAISKPRPLQQITNSPLSFDNPKATPKRLVGMPPSKLGPNKRLKSTST